MFEGKPNVSHIKLGNRCPAFTQVINIEIMPLHLLSLEGRPKMFSPRFT